MKELIYEDLLSMSGEKVLVEDNTYGYSQQECVVKINNYNDQIFITLDNVEYAFEYDENGKCKDGKFTVLKIDKFAELEIASKPLIDFLNKYYDPMTTAIVTEGRVDILVSDMGMPLEVRD